MTRKPRLAAVVVMVSVAAAVLAAVGIILVAMSHPARDAGHAKGAAVVIDTQTKPKAGNCTTLFGTIIGFRVNDQPNASHYAYGADGKPIALAGTVSYRNTKGERPHGRITWRDARDIKWDTIFVDGVMTELPPGTKSFTTPRLLPDTWITIFGTVEVPCGSEPH